MKNSICAAVVILGLAGGAHAQTALEQLKGGRYAEAWIPAVPAEAASAAEAVGNPYRIARTKAITIYFCGTGITRDMWKAEDAHSPDGATGFWSPELISTLFREQAADSYKLIVNGIGTDAESGSLASAFAKNSSAGKAEPNSEDRNLFSLFDQGFPSSPLARRGWARCLDEAMAYINSILASTTGDITLNLVGHSRGGVLALMAANKIKDNPRIKTINILALDPVPGDTSLSPGIYGLSGKVKNYVGIYVEDERTIMFEPVIPAAGSGTKVWLLTLPGSHEAFVGNTQKDGHSRNNYFGAKPKDGDTHLPEMEPVARLTKIIAMELLASQNWGGVRSNWNWRQKTLEGSRADFLKTAREMRSVKAAELYKYQRTVSYLPSFNPFRTSLTAFKDGAAYDISYSDVQAGVQNEPRVVYKMEGRTLGIMALSEAVQARKNPEQILNSLTEFGGLNSGDAAAGGI